ncbi:hypothetical protein [Burkholderia contaminans]|uniref:Uncharacterized protein n=1 Tax=Burkholderia contaminans TaxID=488447 RepID=A0A3N8QS10_9BURK|nr:hypothetical protein [Burkholderia contaminans]RQT22056.1 hypothetical protein DF037_28475 [Burkholderia contaminans]
MKQQRFLVPDQLDVVAHWSEKENKIWAVDVAAGAGRRLAYRHTYYARASTADRAINCVKQNLIRPVPGMRCRARLAGARELGCHRVTAETTPIELRGMAVGVNRVR